MYSIVVVFSFSIQCHTSAGTNELLLFLRKRNMVKAYAMQWSIVFPLGMYAVATNNLALSAEFKPLYYLSSAMMWVALLSWFALMLFLLNSFLIKKNI